MSEQERFFIPTGGSAINAFRAIRAWAERHCAARGETLDPAWYRDGPEDMPELYGDTPRPSAEGCPADEDGPRHAPNPGHPPGAPGTMDRGTEGLGG